MASATEMIQAIARNRAALQSAIEGVSDWEAAQAGDDWSPRQVAEHAIGAERAFAGMIAGALGKEAPAREELSLGSAAQALAALSAAAEAVGPLLDGLQDTDLAAEAPMPEGAPFPKSVEGVLQLSVWHLDDHAKQIAAQG